MKPGALVKSSPFRLFLAAVIFARACVLLASALAVAFALPAAARAQSFYVGNLYDGTIGEYDAATGTPISGFNPSGVTSPLALLLSGNTLYVTNHLGSVVSAIDITTGNPVAGFSPPSDQGNPWGLALSGNTLYVSYVYGNSVSEFDATTGAAINVLTPAGLSGPTGLAVSGNTLYIANFFGGNVQSIDVTTSQPTAGFTTVASADPSCGPNFPVLAGNNLYVDFAPLGGFGVVGAGTVSMYDAATGAPNTTFATITGLQYPTGMVVVGTTLYVADAGTGTIGVYDATTGAPVRTITLPAGPNGQNTPYGLVFTGASAETGVPLTATTLTVDGSAQPTPVAKGEAITFTATQGALAAGGYVQIQATTAPTVEASWTGIADATNGGPGYLAGDGSGNYTLTTTQYPVGRVYFRAVSVQPGQTNTSNVVGYFDLISPDAPALFITQTGSTADDPAAAVAIIGDQITYTLKVYNDGPQVATNLQVFCTVPAGQQLVKIDRSYTVDPVTGTITISYPEPINPTGNAPLLLHIITQVTSDASLGQVFSGLGYRVIADGGDFAQGTDTVTTTVVRPLEVVVTSNSTTVSPGQSLFLRVYVHNRTAATIKNVVLDIPLPDAVHYSTSTLTDSKGLLVAGPLKSGTPVYPVNPVLSSTNHLLAYLGNVAADARDTVSIDLTIPYDVDPAAAITFDDLQVTTKTPVGDSNSFTLPDTTVVLSGVSPATTPQISFSKILLDLPSILQLAVAQPKLAKQFTKVLTTVSADPAQLAAFANVYPQLAALAANPAALKSLTYAQFATALNPDLGYTSSQVSGQPTIPTIPEPAVAKDVPYLAFALTYANTGGASVPAVTISDLVPAGTSILDTNGNFNGSVIINGKPGVPGINMTISADGRTLTFNVGTLAGSQTTAGFIIYKVRLLAAGEPGAFSDGNLISSSGSLLTSPDLSTSHSGQPDGEDIEVVGKYNYYLESTQPTSNSTTLAEGITYDIYYKNTGRASTVLEIDDPIPAGLQYLGCELLDADRKSYDVPAGAVEAPAPAAGQTYPTSGTVVFHPPLFTASGKVAAKASGYVREYFYPLPTALAGGITGFRHAPVVTPSSYGATSRFHGGGTPQAARRDPRTRATDAGATAAGSTSYTQVDDPSLSKVFVATAVPMTMVEGMQYEIFVVEGCLSDKPLLTGTANFVLPPALQYVSTYADTLISTSQQTDSAGNTIVSIQFDFTASGTLTALQGHTARFAKITVQPKAGTASATPLVLPNCYIGLPDGRTSVLQTGPVSTTILTAAQASALSAMKAQVAGNALTAVGTTSPLLSEFIDHIGKASRTIALAGASGLSSTNGVLLVPLLGSPAQTLAIGASSALSGDGTAKKLYTAGLDFLVEFGPSTGIEPGPFTATNGASLPAQSASQIMSDLANNAPGNLVKMGVALLANVGGNNLISQDGGGLISQDGGGAVAKASDLISQDGGTYAAGRSNLDGLISQDGGGLISQDGGGLISQDGGGLISQDGGGLISQDGSSIIATKAGSALAANGANLIGQDGSTLVGSSDNSQILHATTSGNLIQLGSAAGAIGENSSGLVGTQSAVRPTNLARGKH